MYEKKYDREYCSTAVYREFYHIQTGEYSSCFIIEGLTTLNRVGRQLKGKRRYLERGVKVGGSCVGSERWNPREELRGVKF